MNQGNEVFRIGNAELTLYPIKHEFIGGGRVKGFSPVYSSVASYTSNGRWVVPPTIKAMRQQEKIVEQFVRSFRKRGRKKHVGESRT